MMTTTAWFFLITVLLGVIGFFISQIYFDFKDLKKDVVQLLVSQAKLKT